MISWLKANAHKYTASELSEKLNINESTIRYKLDKLDIPFKVSRNRNGINLDFIESEGRHYTLREMSKLFGVSEKNVNSQMLNAFIPFLPDKCERVDKGSRVLRNCNMVKLSVGDRLRVIHIKTDDYGADYDYNCTVIEDYGYYYLVQKDNGVKTTIHKVDESINLRVID